MAAKIQIELMLTTEFLLELMEHEGEYVRIQSEGEEMFVDSIDPPPMFDPPQVQRTLEKHTGGARMGVILRAFALAKMQFPGESYFPSNLLRSHSPRTMTPNSFSSALSAAKLMGWTKSQPSGGRGHYWHLTPLGEQEMIEYMRGIREIGVVRWFNSTEGYGFIENNDRRGRDVFVHITSLQKSGIKTLEGGQKVGYTIEMQRGKLAAVNLELL